MIQELQSTCPRFVRATSVGNAHVLTMLDEGGQFFSTRVYVIGLKREYQTRHRDCAEASHELAVTHLQVCPTKEMPESIMFKV